MYIDEQGRYRGGIPRVGSVDGTHLIGSNVGVNATSSIFESMCDDGANQRGSSSRLAGYHDNGNGTTTLYFKGTLSQEYFGIHTRSGLATAEPTMTQIPKAGDKLFIYASNGHIAFEGIALTNAVLAGAIPECTTDHTGSDSHCCLHIVHIDSNNDCVCDVQECKALMHYDLSTSGSGRKDGKCDKCGTKVYTDYATGDQYAGKGNGQCDVSGVELSDANGDGLNDADGVPILTDMAQNAIYNDVSSQLSYSLFHSNNGTKTITYKCNVYKIDVKTDLVNFEAFEGYDFTDNDYFMKEKVIFDNHSRNSAGFVYDNVMIRYTRSRGVLVKTFDATIRNCTFRDLGMTAILLSVETHWGESTVPQNITIEGCLFDNTGCNYDAASNLTYAPIAIQGLGNLSGTVKVSEDTLPCKNIRIIGNKFINISNNYCITMSAAQDVSIRDNVFVARDGDHIKKKYGKAVYINGCANISIEGNTFSAIVEGDVTKAIAANNYIGLMGSDVEGVFAQDKLTAKD